jgi:uncharacterized membrane protein
MDFTLVVGFVNLFLAGLLAGEEFTIRFGVRGPLASLEDIPHIRFRQALIYRLRVLVPAIFGLTILSGLAVLLLSFGEAGFVFRGLAVLSLVGFILLTMFGTVPINAAALEWNPISPPANWQALIRRWERLDDIRCGAAVVAFALFLIAMAL